MASAKELDSNLIRIFLRQIAQENAMESETSVEAILEKYLKNPLNRSGLLSQIKNKGCVNRILVIGHAGAGKSSVINLLMNNNEAKVSNAAVGCTFKFDEYQVIYGDEFYEIIDTIGLNEASRGTVPPKDAIKQLIDFIKKNRRGFNCVLFVMKQGRLDDAFEKNHMLFYKTLLESKIPAILFISHCEQDDPMNTWIGNEINSNALQSYEFAEIICGTAREVSGRLASYLPKLREETYQYLWQGMIDKKLEKPIAIEPDLNLFKRLWNSFAEYLNLQWKFVTDRFADFLKYLKSLGVDDQTIKAINQDLH